MSHAELTALRAEAAQWIEGQHGAVRWNQETLALAKRLKGTRQFDLLSQLTERAARLAPHEPALRGLHAQALIETGHAAAALDVLRTALRELPEESEERLELLGLVGRAYKQMFVDSPGKRDEDVGQLLKQAMHAYGTCWTTPQRPYWHGVNYLALRRLAGRLGIVQSVPSAEEALARELLDRTPTIDANGNPDPWGLATRFEAALVFPQADIAHTYLRDFLACSPAPFNVGTLLRQLEQVWTPGASDTTFRQLVDALRAHHASLPGAQIAPLPANSVGTMQRAAPLPDPTLEAIFGQDGLKTMEWWKKGLAAAHSIAAIVSPEGRTIGTGFAVEARALCERWEPGVVVLTNYHVCNSSGASPALHMLDAQVAFTALDPQTRYQVSQILCESPSEVLDFAVLRLAEPIDRVAPLPIKLRLPARPTVAMPNRVFVIGHPDGRGLEFSVLGSELLDVEQLPAESAPGEPGKGGVIGRQRLHYRTPTEKGNSGSPVFPSSAWEVIALHHAGGELRRFNDGVGTWQANEGIALASIKADINSRC